MKKHIELLGILHLVYAGVSLAIAVCCFVFLTGIGYLTHDAIGRGVLGAIAVIVCAAVSLLALPGIIAGIGLMKMRSWARILAMIVGCVHMLSIPFGTALGVYTLWVLMNDESGKLLS